MFPGRRARCLLALSITSAALLACSDDGPSSPETTTTTERLEGDGTRALVVGERIDLAEPSVRIAFDDGMPLALGGLPDWTAG